MDPDETSPIRRRRIHRPDGITSAERYLKRLCDCTFLSLWSYSGPFRDQSGDFKSAQGKEICDLLVVFENHVVIFSDKESQFPNSGNLDRDWRKWYRRAIESAANQIWGAERWIKTFPHRIFLDRACTQRLPLELPDETEAQFHRVIVAHGVSERCRQHLGGSGSLMIVPGIVGPMHQMTIKQGGLPFAIGQVDPAKGFFHVLDDTTLEIVLGTLDTITDFVGYLSKKERFIRTGRLASAAGDEDLLAFYFNKLNAEGNHDFIVPNDTDYLTILEGLWNDFANSPERRAQIDANQVSYNWDALIEKFSAHILAGTQYRTSHTGVSDSEKIMRFLAREPRTRRRMLAKSIIELIEKTPKNYKATRVLMPSRLGDPFYVFLLLPLDETIDYSEYRTVRHNLLQACCMVTKLKFPEAQDIVGIATETGLGSQRSEDSMYFDAREWNPEMEAEAKRLQEDFGLLTNPTIFRAREMEFPTEDNQSRKSEKN